MEPLLTMNPLDDELQRRRQKQLHQQNLVSLQQQHTSIHPTMNVSASTINVGGPVAVHQLPQQHQSSIVMSLRQLQQQQQQQQQFIGAPAGVPPPSAAAAAAAMSAPALLLQQQQQQASLAFPPATSELLLRLMAANEREIALRRQQEELQLQRQLAQLTAAAQRDIQQQQKQVLTSRTYAGANSLDASSVFNQQPGLSPFESEIHPNPTLVRNKLIISSIPEGELDGRPHKKAKYESEKTNVYNKKPRQPAAAKPIKPKKKDIKWMNTLQQLKEYRKVHGDCLVPRGFDSNPRLASWVAEQRKQYKLLSDGKQSSITLERISLLNEIDFAWNAQEAAWSRNMNDLKQFRSKHNHCHVPLNHPEFPKLGLWVKEQRRHYTLLKQGKVKQSHMTIERANALDEIGFCWDTHEATWLERLKELTEYKRKYGTCIVPTSYADNPKLGTWVHHQRRQYKKHQEGKPCHITEARIKALDELGFVWRPRARVGMRVQVEEEEDEDEDDDTSSESEKSDVSSVDFRPRSSVHFHPRKRAGSYTSKEEL